MNPVGTDQHIAPRRQAMRAVAVEEVGAHAGFVLPEISETMAGVDARLAEAGADCLVDDRL